LTKYQQIRDFVEEEIKWSRDLYFVTVTHELNILVIMH